jgi:hypothetical protein
LATTPASKLDVQGDIQASGTITSGSSITIDCTNDRITATGGTIDFDDENLVTTGRIAVSGTVDLGAVIEGINSSSDGDSAGVKGESAGGEGRGVYGYSRDGDGVYGGSNTGHGVYGHSPTNVGVHGGSNSGDGVQGISNTGAGVYGKSPRGKGVYGYSYSGMGVYGEAGGADGYAGYFLGRGYFSGYVGIGTTSPTAKLDVDGQIKIRQGSPGSGKVLTCDASGLASWETPSTPWSISGSNVYRSIGYVGIGTKSPTHRVTLPNTWDASGQGMANAWVIYSSRRWKTNVRPIENAMEKVEKLRGVRFHWKQEGKGDIGMIAEEVGEVIPEVVGYEENGVDAVSLDYARLVALLVEAIKEQERQIREQQDKIATLEELVAQTESFKQRLVAVETKMERYQLGLAKEEQR